MTKFKSVLFLGLLFISYSVCLAHAESEETSKLPEVVLAGDSWATLPCFFGSPQAAFANRDIKVDIHDCLRTTKIGTRAENYASTPAYQEVIQHLQTNPLVKVVYLSIGGNDMLDNWQKTLTLDEENALFKTILTNSQAIINEFRKVRPDVWIYVSGYDMGYLYANNPIPNYKEIYEHMGSPTPIEVNSGFLRFAQYMTQLKADHVVFQHHFGLMQYYYGAPEAGLGPKKTAPPDMISPESNPSASGCAMTARNNKWAQAHIFDFFFDPHHLRPQGFMRVFEHAIDGYIGKMLDPNFEAHPRVSHLERFDGTVSAEMESQGNQMVQEEFRH